MKKKINLRLVSILLVSLLLLGSVFFSTLAQDMVTLDFVDSGHLTDWDKFVVEKFNETHPNIKVKTEEIPWGQVYQQLVTRIQAGDAPDIFTTGSRFVPTMVTLDGVEPLDQYLSLARKDEYFDSIWDTTTYNGHIYAIPMAFSTKALYYNKALFKEAGVEELMPPENWEELKAAAKAIDENTDAYGYALGGKKFISTTSQFLSFLYQNGGRVFDAEGNITINNEAGVEALAFYDSLKEYAEPGPTGHNREDLRVVFKEGKAGMYVSGPWRRNLFLQTEGMDFGVATLPAGPGGKSRCILVTDSMMISKDSPHKEEAATFLLYYTNFQNQLIRNTGIGVGSVDPTAGLTPMRKIASQLPFYENTWHWKPFIDMIPRGVQQPLLGNWQGFQDALTNAIQSVLLDKSEPKEALDKVAAELEEMPH